MSSTLIKLINYQKKRAHNHSAGSVQKFDQSTKASSIAKFSKNNSRKKTSSRSKKISLGWVKNWFDNHIHIPGTSFSSSLLNESFEVLKNMKSNTLDDDF